jgi:hypothetical protein
LHWLEFGFSKSYQNNFFTYKMEEVKEIKEEKPPKVETPRKAAVSEQELNDIKKGFGQIDGGDAKEKKVDTVQKNDKGQFKHKGFAKQFAPQELTDGKIMEIVEEQFPLLPSTEPEKERNQRSKHRSKLKSALKERSQEAKQEKQPTIEIKEEDPEKQRLIANIMKIQVVGGDQYAEEELNEMSVEDLKGLIGSLGNGAMDTIQNHASEFMFSMLCLTSQTAETVCPMYGWNMKGLYEKHKEAKEQLLEVLEDVLQENPEVAKFFSPNNRLFLTLAGLYATVAFENNMKK